ncbi:MULTISPECIES: DUF1854 domain-containing protein [Variovorax]|jgi:hypothetical protein|uniref:cyanophycin metabolism-associated DUF1854 family protein n=1 Tax=Variovorax TaxID=34072 RepID=UPI00086A2577|nr:MULTISPECIES: DUF1854 domain-containing protein [Variovorax]MBN8754044.1 DUF1854 domain-containing protein [Variovorax sp.]ODU15264.1 MAG: hypothetical protein ABS94_18550 [Variovorax sp. SCN 67-85]ODV26629.1 MAG: hypothetical protein ABT25_04995 [Variovorax sp. SCN 67-20]OJZ04617.1 MAG: hypothetical protein BGP22_14375 [Variovorax sp. 67-131]UKI09818.1 DUF1854 domain-containing protein [Variovorax paradoxus]
MTENNTTPSFELERDALGRLVLTDAQGERHVGIVPVRAFPLSAPGHGVSLVGGEGRELVWIDSVDQLPPQAKALLQEELAVRDFAPTLLRLHGVSSFGVPSTWTISTDRGDTTFVLKAEEDIRRLEGGALLIASAHGVQFRIPDVKTLDRASRKLLERFL